MKHTMKKVLSLVLTLSMVLSLVSINAGAATIDPGTRNFGANASRVYTSPDGFTIYYNAGGSLSQNEGYTLQGALDAIENMSSDDVYGIVISSGTHTISNNHDDHVDNGIWVKSGVNLTVSDCQDSDLFFVEEGAHLTISDGAKVQGNGGKLTVNDGSVYATGTFSEVTGTVKTYQGDDTLTINGGSATVDSTETYSYGYYSGNVAGYENTITINGGTVTVSGSRNDYYYHDDSTYYNSPTDTLVIKGGTVKAGNNDFTAVNLNGGTYDFNSKASQPTINGGANGTGTLKIGSHEAKIQGSFAKIEGTGALELAGDTAIGGTASTMNVYSNSSNKLTLGSDPIDENDHRTVGVKLVSELNGTGDGSYCTYTSVGTVIVYANAQVSVIGNTDNRDSDNAYIVGMFVGMGGSVSVSKETHEYDYFNCASGTCGHGSGSRYHKVAFDVTMPTFEGEFANIDLKGRLASASDTSGDHATIRLSGDTTINGLAAADAGLTIDGTMSGLDTENYDLIVNTTTAVNVKNVNNLTVGDGEKAAKVTVVGPVKNANVKENATLTMADNSDEGTTYITGTVTGENGTFTNNDSDAVLTAGEFKGGTGGNQGESSENDLTLTTENSNQKVTGTYGTLTINGATGVKLTGTVDKLIVNSGSIELTKEGAGETLTSAWVKETIVINGGAVTMNNGSKIEDLDITADRDAVTLNGGTFTMENGAEITLARHTGHDVALRAIENKDGKVDLKGGTITITGGTNTVAVCNHEDMVIGTVNGALSSQPKITLDYGTAVKNDTVNANTYIYGIDVNINDESASNIGIDADKGLMLILAGQENPDLDKVPAETVNVTVNNGYAVKIGDAATWSIAGPYKSARFTANSSVTAGAGTALYTASSKTPTDPTVVLVSAVGAALETPADNSTKTVNFVENQPLSCGVFSGDVTVAINEGGTQKTVYDLIPARNFDVVDNTNHNTEGWGDTLYFEANKTVIVDVEWVLRHAATQSATFTMQNVDADTDTDKSTIYLDEYLFWGAVKDDDLDVTGSLTLDLNGKTLTKGENFATDEQLIDVAGTLIISDSYDSDDTTEGVQTIGKIDASALTDAILVKTGNLTVNSGTIIGGTNGIKNVYDSKGTQTTTDDTHGTIALISGGTIYGATTGINNAGTITTISGGTIGKNGTSTSTTGIVNAATGVITTISSDSTSSPTISGTTYGINNSGTIGATTGSPAVADKNKGILGGTISGATALNYADGHIYNIIGGTFTGTTTGMYVDNDADGWNFLRVGSTNTGAVFTGITVENGSSKTLNDLLNNNLTQEDLTFKDNNSVELGSGVRGGAALNAATDLSNTSTKTVGSVLTKVTATDKAVAPFTVIKRTVSEITYKAYSGETENVSAVSVSESMNTVLYDADFNSGMIFVKRDATPVITLSVADTANLIKEVKVTKTVGETDGTSGTANYTTEQVIGAAANKDSAVLTYKAVANYDGSLTATAAKKTTIYVNETANKTDGTVSYVYTGIGTYGNDAAMTIANVGTENVTAGATLSFTNNSASFLLAQGNTATLTVDPDDNHQIHTFTVDTISQTAKVDQTAGEAQTLSLTGGDADKTIAVEFCDVEAAPSVSTTASVYVNDTVTLTATLAADAHDSTVNWSMVSGDTDLSINPTTGVVTAAAAATVGDTATFKATANGKESSVVTVTVIARPSVGGGGGGGAAPTSYTVKVDNSAVKADKTSASEGAKVTLTVKAEDAANLIVLDKNGKEVALTKVNATTYTFKMPASNVTVSLKSDEASSVKFVDVPANAYYADAVDWAVAKGITNGVDVTHFAPNAGTTRAQVVTFLWRAAGCPAPKGDASQFADVNGDMYYAKAVAWAIENGITNGTAADAFNPNAICTRAQIVTFMARFAGVKDAASKTDFVDVNVNSYYANAVAWAVENGVTNGVTADTFAPNNTCTRAQVVTFLYRLLVK